MKRLSLALALATLSFAPPCLASHSWNDYHWGRTSVPFTLQLLNNTTTSGWSGILSLVSADWSASTVLHTSIMNGTGGNSCKPKAGTIQVCNRKYGFNGWLGLAQIWVSGNHITQATAKVNDSYFNSTAYNNDSAKRHVLCQEIGHAFGLGHQSFPGSRSCMDDVNGLFDPAYAGPNAHDYEELAAIYGSHNDATGTIARLGAAGVSDEEGPNVPGNFGRPAGTGRVPEILFVRTFPDGTMLFTWVVAAPLGNPDAR